MTQSTMRIHGNAASSSASASAAPKKSSSYVRAHQQSEKPQAKRAEGNAQGQSQQSQGQSEPRPAETPSDVIANAASETKKDRGVYASMKKAFSPYVEHHSHAVLYGVLGFIAAALILIVGFWPTVLLAVFAAIGVVIGKYRDGDRKTREQMKHVLDRFN